MKTPLAQWEAQMEALVEGIFADQLQPHDITVRLIRALEDSAVGSRPPATHYIVRFNASDAERLLRERPALAEELAEALVQAAREAHFTLPRQPEIVILPDDDLKPRQMAVVPDVSFSDLSHTQGLIPPQPRSVRPPAVNISAFLIINGKRTLPLDQPLMNIGRRKDNQIILDDLSVSRSHAQLRLRFGKYMLYDLGSHSGTLVNGRRIQECVLQPGDVITLGGVQLIYGEGTISQVPGQE
jgi:hypothetical protein